LSHTHICKVIWAYTINIFLDFSGKCFYWCASWRRKNKWRFFKFSF